MGPGGEIVRANAKYDPYGRDPAPVSWFKGSATYIRAAEARIDRWLARRAAALNGGPVLHVFELDDLIHQTEAALAVAPPGDAANLAVQLDDMHRELETRRALGEDKTEWPRATVRGHVVT